MKALRGQDGASAVSGEQKPMRKLSAAEKAALQLLQEEGGSLIEWRVPETTEKEPVFGTIVPGIPVYQKLERMGLVFFTEEEPFDCWRRLNSDPPCRSNIDPGRIAEFGISNCG